MDIQRLSEMELCRMGRWGADYIDDTALHIGRWGRITAQQLTKIDVIEGNWDHYPSQLYRGEELDGNFTAIKLKSGAVHAYRMHKEARA